ncbi:hypothetical protein AAFF_G00084210 [Aldrovandia affinis]|uniref:Uncharacterized protein n=1 Tax=Aldrovandia affinis TaxID=143900 RepID=A0AAD7WCX1_9TELE|nr:hypothetical protein AAFF_G00084210 [Aldrovandia affinis]
MRQFSRNKLYYHSNTLPGELHYDPLGMLKLGFGRKASIVNACELNDGQLSGAVLCAVSGQMAQEQALHSEACDSSFKRASTLDTTGWYYL